MNNKTTASNPDLLEHFSTLVPEHKSWFTTSEVANIFGKSSQYIRNVMKNKVLHGHLMPHFEHSGKPRYTYLIHRDSILMWMLNTANYTIDDFYAQLNSILIRRASKNQLLSLIDDINEFVS